MQVTMSSEDVADPVARFVRRARLRHLCTALSAMRSGSDHVASHFMGDPGLGLFHTIDQVGNHHGIAWDDTGLVALVYERDDDDEDVAAQEAWERKPEGHWRSAPPRLHYLGERIAGHLVMQKMATAGVWLTRENPDLAPLKKKRLRMLQGYLLEPEVALRGDRALGWEGWRLSLPTWQVAIEIEEASHRTDFYEVTEAQGEALIPAEWFAKAGDPPARGHGSRMGESITYFNIRLCVQMLADLGIHWPSAVDIAKARGVPPDAERDDGGCEF